MKLPRLELSLQVATRSAGVPGAQDLQRWASAATRRACRLTLRVVGRPEARRLNRDFRGRDYATNVLTFVYQAAGPCEGDLVLCAPVVSLEARRQGKAVEAHWAHLVVHGMLHLQGFDHEEAREAAAMERLETEILRELGYPDPYLMAA